MAKVKEKPRLISISKSAFVSQYTLDKNNNVPRALLNFFLDLGIDEENFGLKHFLISEDFYNGDENKERFLSIENMEDYRCNIKNNIYDIDFFIGYKKVFLIIRTEEDSQQKIVEKLFKFVEMED